MKKSCTGEWMSPPLIVLALFLLSGCMTSFVGKKINMNNKLICHNNNGRCVVNNGEFTADYTVEHLTNGAFKVDGKIKPNFKDVGNYRSASISVLGISKGVIVSETPSVQQAGDLEKGIPFSCEIYEAINATAVVYEFQYR